MTLNRHIQPVTQMITDIPDIRPEEIRLSNNIPVYLINAGTQDIVKIDFLFDAGNWFQPQPLVAGFTNSMLKEGSRNYSASEIADNIDFYGAHLEANHDKDTAIVSLYTLNKYLDKTLPLVGEIILYPTFPEDELKLLKQNRKQKHIVNSEKVRYLAKKKFNTIIYGPKHPYGSTFDLDSFDRVKRNDIKEFHQNYYSLSNCHIIVSGKIIPGLTDSLDKIFGQIKNIPHLSKKIVNLEPVQLNGRINHYKKENSVQSAFRIGKVMFNKTHPDYFGFNVLNTILGGYFGSRLMSNIREDKGYTYGIGSALVSLRNSGYFFITSETGSDVTSDAMFEVYKEIEKLQHHLVSDDELELVKNYMFGNFLRNIDGAFARADSFRGLLEYDLDYTFFHKYIEVIKTISPEDIRTLAQKWLQKDSLIELTVGN